LANCIHETVDAAVGGEQDLRPSSAAVRDDSGTHTEGTDAVLPDYVTDETAHQPPRVHVALGRRVD